MEFVQAPNWQYYPSNARPPLHLQALLDGVVALGPWLQNHWWPTIHPGARGRDTKEITSALEPFLPPTLGAVPQGPFNFQEGWNLEMRESYRKMPYLYGERHDNLGAVDPDGVHVAAGRLTLFEVEGGGALRNYKGMKDIVETMLLPAVDYLALMVPFRANGMDAYRYYNRLTQALYAEQVVQAHLSGIAVIGF